MQPKSVFLQKRRVAFSVCRQNRRSSNEPPRTSNFVSLLQVCAKVAKVEEKKTSMSSMASASADRDQSPKELRGCHEELGKHEARGQDSQDVGTS